jgi:hypothetical protein
LFSLPIFREQLVDQDRLAPKTCGYEVIKRGCQVEQTTQRARTEEAQGTGSRNSTAIGLRTTLGVVDEEEHWRCLDDSKQ